MVTKTKFYLGLINYKYFKLLTVSRLPGFWVTRTHSRTADIWNSFPANVHLFDKDLQSTCSVSGTVIGTRDTLVNGTEDSGIKRSGMKSSACRLSNLRGTVPEDVALS